MQYKIRDFNAATGSLLVQFYTADFPDGLMYNVDVPLVNGEFISGQALDDHIMIFAPYGQIERAIALRNAAAPNVVIEPLPTTPPTTPLINPPLTPLKFMDRFTDQEQLTIAAATLQNAQVKLWYDKMIAATEIVLSDQRLLVGMQGLVAAGLLTQARMDQILPGDVRFTGMPSL